MYTFQPVTDRIKAIRHRVRNHVIQIDSERATLITNSYQVNENLPPILKRARGTYDFVSQMTLRVEDDEIFVGNRATTFGGAAVYPEWEGRSWILNEIENGNWTMQEDGLYHNPAADELRMAVSPKDYDNLRNIFDYWKTHTIGHMADAWKPRGYDVLCGIAACANNNVNRPLMSMSAGHLTPGFEKIIRVGYGAIREQANEWLDTHANDLMGDDAEKCLFYEAVVIICDAAEKLICRYSDLCAEKAAAASTQARKEELIRMSKSLRHIATGPASSFWEACQAALLYQLFLALDSKIPAVAFGRFDQYTYPLLKKDMESGTITYEQAQEYVDAFFLKAGTYYAPAHPAVSVITGIGNTYQHTTIGGIDPVTGEDASNPVTYMALESLSRLSLHDPTISLRINKGTPNKLWELAIETSKTVGGLPLFMNDDVIIPGLIRELHFTEYDARNYALIGCQEITGSGNDYSACNGIAPPYGSIHYGVALSMAINNGVNPMNQKSCGIETGYLYNMTSFEEVLAAYEKLARFVTRAQVSINNYTEIFYRQYAQLPALSISMEGCMESGRDATAGGCKYNSYGGTATGLATVADSLTAIRYMVFDKKLCTAQELYDAVQANWEGYEELRQQIISAVPHYGNNDPYADEMMKWVCDLYYDICKSCYSSRTKVFKAGLYSAADHVYQGFGTWATPDGRKSGTPIADGTSPVQGRDTNGPLAVCNSAVCFDHANFMDGMALNIRIHPTALSRDDGAAKLRDMTKAYLDNGGMEIQYNVVSSETLRKAQENPDEYHDLVVRIAGYSAYFVELSHACQNDIISRTENQI